MDDQGVLAELDATLRELAAFREEVARLHAEVLAKLDTAIALLLSPPD